MSVDSLAVGVYGRLGAPAPGGAVADADCFSAFVALGSVLGWLASPGAETPTGLWGMNDAGGPWFGEHDPGLRGWFQVSPDGSDHALLLETVTVAAVTSVERFGTLDLTGLEYYVPPGPAGRGRKRLLDGHGWFALARPDARARLHLTLDSGDSPVVAERADQVLDALASTAPTEEGVDAQRLDDRAEVDLAEPVPWRWWLGAGAPHTVTVAASASEWSPLGVGRVVACLVEACRDAGITDAIGVRVARAPRVSGVGASIGP